MDAKISEAASQAQTVYEPERKTRGEMRSVLRGSPYRSIPYLLQALLIALVLTIELGLVHRDLSVPIDYRGDTVYEEAIVKAITRDGWWWHVRDLSAPEGLYLDGVPILGNLDCAIIKLFALFSQQAGLVQNLYWLTTVLLAGAISTWCLQRLGVQRWVAFGLGILYALSPHIYYRHTAHMMLTHHLIPLIVTTAIFLALGRTDVSRSGSGWYALLLGCVLIGFSYVYWAFFSCFILLTGGLIGFLRQRNYKLISLGGLAAGLVVIAAFANLSPSIWAWKTEPSLRKFITYKSPAEADVWGLKIRQLIAPGDGSPIPLLSHIAAKIRSANFPLENENALSRMGLVASMGFLLTIAIAVFWVEHERGPTIRVLKAVGALTSGVYFVGNHRRVWIDFQPAS